MAEQRRSSLLQFALIFLVVYMGSQVVMRTFFPDQATPNGNGNGGAITLRMQDATVKAGHHPVVVVRNGTDADLTLADRCPLPPFTVWELDTNPRTELIAEETALPCEPLLTVPAHGSVTYSLGPWKYSLFSKNTRYALTLVLPDGQQAQTEFSVHEAGVPTQIFRTFITKPLLNFLILIASLLPGYNLGAAVILLTLIVKLILFIPTQHALEGQKKLQILQPKLDEIRRKYKDDPKKMNEETLALWKREKINPFQSCLPMLLQFPVLIGLFFVIRDGSVIELSRHLLYPPYLDLPWKFGMHFLGLDLTHPNPHIFVPLLVILQFVQMKLTFAITARKKAAKNGTDPAKEKGKEKGEMENMQAVQQKVMLYGLPLMIGFFAYQVPSAVSLYWGVSTLFAIGQQIVVNKEHLPGMPKKAAA